MDLIEFLKKILIVLIEYHKIYFYYLKIFFYIINFF